MLESTRSLFALCALVLVHAAAAPPRVDNAARRHVEGSFAAARREFLLSDDSPPPLEEPPPLRTKQSAVTLASVMAQFVASSTLQFNLTDPCRTNLPFYLMFKCMRLFTTATRNSDSISRGIAL
jgi:hypothetical protein